MKILWILLMPLLLSAQNYLQVGDYRVYPYSPTGLANWPTGYLAVTIDSANTQVAVDSVGSGETYQAFKSGVLERFMRNGFTFLDSFYIYSDGYYSVVDPIGVGYYDPLRRDLGIQGDMIRMYAEAYKATKESKYLNKAVRLWEQFQDSSYVVKYSRDGLDSVRCLKWRPQIESGFNPATDVNIVMGMYDLYEKIGTQEWSDYAHKYYSIALSWSDTVDAVGDTIRNFNFSLYPNPDSEFRYNYGAYHYGFLMYATAKGFGNHSVSGDSLLYHMENYFRGGIDSTTQLRRTTPTSGGTWSYTGMEMAYDIDGALAMRAAGFNEPYWDDWQYLIDGLMNTVSTVAPSEGQLEGMAESYFLGKDLGFTVNNKQRATQCIRTIVNQLYLPMWGFGLGNVGLNHDYVPRFSFWGMYYTIRYLKNYVDPIDAMPVMTDSLFGGTRSADGVITQSSGYNMTYIAALKFDLAAVDSFTFSVDNDSSMLYASWFHGDTTCTIKRISNSYFMEIECSHPTRLIIGEPAPPGIYDATAIVVADTSDTTVYMANMPAGKDTTITYPDSVITFLFDIDEFLICKSDSVRWTFSIDNKTIKSAPIRKATISAYGASIDEYNKPANRNRFFHMQKRIIKWLYDRRLSRLAMGYAQ